GVPGSAEMNWVTEGWRLKLLAIGLSALMLGAGAFAQNPPGFRNVHVPTQYTIPPNLVVLNAPTKTTVKVTGLADLLQTVSATSILATFDLTKVTTPGNVKVNLAVTSLVKDVFV